MAMRGLTTCGGSTVVLASRIILLDLDDVLRIGPRCVIFADWLDLFFNPIFNPQNDLGRIP
jgi:hypothetical protein